MILGDVMKKRSDDHILSNRNRTTCLSHDQSGDPKQMGHVRNAGSFAVLGVELPRILDGAGKSIAQQKAVLLCVHRVPLDPIMRLYNLLQLDLGFALFDFAKDLVDGRLAEVQSSHSLVDSGHENRLTEDVAFNLHIVGAVT